MITDQTIDRAISKMLVAEQEVERANHTPSGKLSAGSLGKPLQWQMLKMLGVPGKAQDEYTLRFFKRGKDIEEWLIKSMPNVIEQQKLLEYQGAIGYADTVVDTKDYEFKCGIIPVEIKSVKNSKYARILAQKAPDRSNYLQACFYGMAMGAEYNGVCYIAADDLRLTEWVIRTDKYSDEVKKIIANYNRQLEMRTLPEFDPPEKWQANPMYSDYPAWQILSADECMDKLKEEYPESYQKLINLK